MSLRPWQSRLRWAGESGSINAFIAACFIASTACNYSNTGRKGKLLYFTRSRPEPSPWSISTSGGEETEILNLNLGRNWAVGEQGIYYLSLPPTEPEPYTLDYFDFVTRKTTRIGTLPGSARSLFINVITLSPDERSIVYSQRDQLDYDLMMVEGFR